MCKHVSRQYLHAKLRRTHHIFLLTLLVTLSACATFSVALVLPSLPSVSPACAADQVKCAAAALACCQKYSIGIHA